MREYSINTFVATLKKTGYKVTKERLLVLSFLSKTSRPASVKEILSKMRNMDQVTLYRTLGTFKKLGIVHQIDFQDSRAYFELSDEKNDHHHVVCVECKKIKDFKGCDYNKLAHSKPKQLLGFAKITSHSFELFGVCNSCIKE